MHIRIGDIAPDFAADTTEGEIKFHDWISDHWCLFFSHPKDFTPVCSTELGAMAAYAGAFEARGCKVIGLGVDPVSDHAQWSEDIKVISGQALNYPVIGDEDLEIAKAYGMLPAGALPGHTRTAMDNATVRSVFLIDPNKIVRLHMSYPMTCGRNFNEVLRVLDSMILTDTRKVGTPANWTEGDEVLILPSVTDDAARELFPNGWRAPKPYARFVKLPAA